MSHQQKQTATSDTPHRQHEAKHQAELDDLNDAIAALIRVTVLLIRRDTYSDYIPHDRHAHIAHDRVSQNDRIKKLEVSYDQQVKDRAACLKHIAHINRDVATMHESIGTLVTRLTATQEIIDTSAKSNDQAQPPPLGEPQSG